ncbi:MAG: amidase [Burkholderiales bacterium]|nr:amidase [Burkholderiales bacterium]MDE1927630.1 amidase [Burkholderiales bacterium]MDE2158721.1 amidase [Burkholderiales bacterium]
MKPEADATARTVRALDAINAHDPALRAFCDIRAAAARADARALDDLPAHRRQALHGVPVAVKEVFDVADLRCSWGTPIHAERRPGVDCEAVLRLKGAGAVVVGTVTSTEYAMARAAPTGNPYALERTPGASSSGSAAAVAAGLVDLALGSQTIGSGIRPAAYCGVLGLKPTHGAIPLGGAMPLSAPLDHAVILARDIDLVAAAWTVLGAPMPDADEQGRLQRVQQDAKPAMPRVAFVEPWFDEAVDARMGLLVEAAALRLAGGDVVRIKVPPAVQRDEQDCLETILACDMWRHHGADAQIAGERMSPALKAWLERGRLIDETSYQRELARRDELIQTMLHATQAFDVLVTLATTGVAPLRSEGTGSRSPQRLWTLLGWPAIAVPIGLLDGLPVAVQLIARAGEEWSLLSLARQLCAAFPTPLPGGWASQSRP